MNTKALVGIGVLAVAAVGAYTLGFLGFGSSKKIVSAIIFITPTQTAGACAATTVPGRVQVKKNEEVEWSMVDLCGATAGYTKDFELRWSTQDGYTCDDGTKNPLDSESKGKLHLRRGINERCKEGKVFKYEIWVETTRLADPELEIAQ